MKRKREHEERGDEYSLVEMLMMLPSQEEHDWEDAISKRISEFPTEANKQALLIALQQNAATRIISALLQACPQAVCSKGSMGEYEALHKAVFSSSTEIVLLVMKANPRAVREAQLDGTVALHHAESVETARLLIKEYPQAIGVASHQNTLALHVALEDVNYEMAELLLDQSIKHNIDAPNGESIVCYKDARGVSPLDIVCRLFAQFKYSDDADDAFLSSHDDSSSWMDGTATPRLVGVESMENLMKENDEEQESSNLFTQGVDEDGVELDWRSQPLERYYQKDWNLIAKMARVAFSTGPFRNQTVDYPVLHALVSLKCKPDVIWFALRTNPHLCTANNSEGDTPLCVAARNPDIDEQVIHELLEGDCGCRRAASIPDAKGRLPLHLAAESGRNVETILKAEPRALQTRDLTTLMHPFMLSAPSGELETIYKLLREDPSVLIGYGSPPES